jgi:hypothetical protein
MAKAPAKEIWYMPLKVHSKQLERHNAVGDASKRLRRPSQPATSKMNVRAARAREKAHELAAHLTELHISRACNKIAAAATVAHHA